MALPPQPLSPLDGRYAPVVTELGEHLSEAGLNRARVHVEIEWLLLLTERRAFGVEPLSAEQRAALREWAAGFGENDIAWLAQKERETRHDVKAVEYLIRAKLTELGLDRVAELVHFAATSEDINNLAYAITIRDALREVWLPKLDALVTRLAKLAKATAGDAMLAASRRTRARPMISMRQLSLG